MGEINIEGLDIEDGLKRLRNNKVLYKRLLNNFFVDNMFTLLNESAKSSDVKGTRAYAHSIKGAAANLSLNLISNMASKLDDLLKPEDAVITPECMQIITEIMRITDETKEKVNELIL